MVLPVAHVASVVTLTEVVANVLTAMFWPDERCDVALQCLAMIRRVRFALCVLALCAFAASASACQDQATSLTPDPAVGTTAPAAATVASAAVATASAIVAAASPTAGEVGKEVAKVGAPTAAGDHKAKEQEKPAQANVPLQQAKPAKAPAAKPSKAAKSELKLLNPGAAPRQVLRLKVKKGQVETMRMVLTMKVNVKELKQKQSLPPMAMTMRLKVVETRANGDIRYNFTLTETDVKGSDKHDPRLVAAMKQAMQKMYGLSGYAVVSDRGLNREAKINLPPTVDAQTKQVMQGMEQAMQQIGAPLPIEAVGKGAKWAYTTKLNQGGVRLTQVATYELLSIANGKLVLKATMKQSAPKQNIAAPNGMKVALLKLQSRGKGKTRMSLSRLAPSKSNMKMKSKMVMGAGDGKQMSIITTMLIDISAR